MKMRFALTLLGLLLGTAAVPAAAPSPPALPAGLVDATGAAFDNRSLGGRYGLVYFGYTHCPEICPTSLFEMVAALNLLDPAGRTRVAPVFVTLDPARDTAASMARYVEPLDADILTVSGTLDAIDRLAWLYEVVVVRNLNDGPDYTLDHTSSVLLLGPGGEVIERFPYEMDYREVARRIADRLAAAPRS